MLTGRFSMRWVLCGPSRGRCRLRCAFGAQKAHRYRAEQQKQQQQKQQQQQEAKRQEEDNVVVLAVAVTARNGEKWEQESDCKSGCQDFTLLHG